ncbi:MAG: hypothetical protein ABEL76_15930, partial [Bradymonadaceae bacterium]
SPGSGETETGDEEEEDDLDLFEDDEEASETAPSSAETESDGRSPTTDATDSEVGLHDESSPDETVDDVPFPEAEEPSDATGDSESDSDETTLAVGDVPQDDDSYLASGADDGDVAPAGVSGEGTDFAEETGEVDPEPEADESSPLEIDEEVGSDLADREPGGFSADAPETGVESSGIDPTPEPTSESGDSVTRTTPATGTSDIDPSPRARVAGDAFFAATPDFLVANAFLAYVAVQNGGFIDFAKFRQMLSVAFQGGEYEPREEWTEPAPAPKVKAPQEPLSFENTVARTLELEGDSPKRLLVLSGRVKNETDETISNVEVRGLVFDKQGRRRAETTAPVGVYLSDQKLRSADSPEDLLPDAASPIEPHRSQPYTVIFTDPPDEVFEGGPVRYGVEVAGEK